MEQFKLFLELGYKHVLDINGYDHILFLMVLAVPYLLENWKKVLFLVTAFTVGHCMALFLSVYGIVNVKSSLVEFLIPVTIAIAAIYNIIIAKKSITQQKIGLYFFSTLFFGIIHGLGFSGYFKLMIGRQEDKLMPLLEFALGIEIAQVIIVIIVLLLGMVMQTLFKVSKRDWILVMSSIVIGLVTPMLLER